MWEQDQAAQQHWWEVEEDHLMEYELEYEQEYELQQEQGYQLEYEYEQEPEQPLVSLDNNAACAVHTLACCLAQPHMNKHTCLVAAWQGLKNTVSCRARRDKRRVLHLAGAGCRRGASRHYSVVHGRHAVARAAGAAGPDALGCTGEAGAKVPHAVTAAWPWRLACWLKAVGSGWAHGRAMSRRAHPLSASSLPFDQLEPCHFCTSLAGSSDMLSLHLSTPCASWAQMARI